MKRIAIVIPANIFRAPYIKYFTDILKENQIKFDIISWNKESLLEDGIQYNLSMKNEVSLIKKYYYYYKFSKFVEKKILLQKYDHIIVHTLQLGIFLEKFLIKNYKKKYFIDIRDYTLAAKLKNKMTRLLINSQINFISSEGFKEWLPIIPLYILSHNIDYNRVKWEYDGIEIKEKNVISTIGTIRDEDILIKFIDKLKDSKRFELHFHGDGPSLEKIKEKKGSNIKFYGRYLKENEKGIYKNSDLINIVIPNDELNSKTLIANRFYNALESEKIILCTQGTYLGDLVTKYSLGIVINFNEDINLEEFISSKLKNFNISNYKEGREKIIKKIKEDEQEFKKIIEYNLKKINEKG